MFVLILAHFVSITYFIVNQPNESNTGCFFFAFIFLLGKKCIFINPLILTEAQFIVNTFLITTKLFVKYNSFCQIENEALWIELSKQFKLDNLVTLCILLNKGCWWMFRLLNKYLTLVTTPCKKGFESWTKQNLFKNLFYNNPSIYI